MGAPPWGIGPIFFTVPGPQKLYFNSALHHDNQKPKYNIKTCPYDLHARPQPVRKKPAAKNTTESTLKIEYQQTTSENRDTLCRRFGSTDRWNVSVSRPVDLHLPAADVAAADVC